MNTSVVSSLIRQCKPSSPHTAQCGIPMHMPPCPLTKHHHHKPTCRAITHKMALHVCAAAATATAVDCKQQLDGALQGLNRGIFGVKAAQLEEIKSLLEQLESQNPLPEPMLHLDQVQGDWKLLFSTITIKGSRRTKLGLREIISLGDFVQSIDIDNAQAINKVHFSVRGLGLIEGALTITAKYTPTSPTRVDIVFDSATLVPEQLERLFQKNYDLLLSIFNPEGWLEVTYVDDTHRIGRDDKGNVFYLHRC